MASCGNVSAVAAAVVTGNNSNTLSKLPQSEVGNRDKQRQAVQQLATQSLPIMRFSSVDYSPLFAKYLKLLTLHELVAVARKIFRTGQFTNRIPIKTSSRKDDFAKVC